MNQSINQCNNEAIIAELSEALSNVIDAIAGPYKTTFSTGGFHERTVAPLAKARAVLEKVRNFK